MALCSVARACYCTALERFGSLGASARSLQNVTTPAARHLRLSGLLSPLEAPAQSLAPFSERLSDCFKLASVSRYTFWFTVPAILEYFA